MPASVSPSTTVVADADVGREALSEPAQESILRSQVVPNVALVPLDSRPVSWLYPIRLADIAGVRLHVPSPELLGWRDREGEPAAILDWISNLPRQVEGLLVCLDALLYGGLVQSRSAARVFISPTDIADFFLRFLAERRGVKLHFMKSVPRIGKSVLSTADLSLHEAMREKATGVKEPEAAEGDSGGDAAPAAGAAWDSYVLARSRNMADHAELLEKLLPLAESWVIAVEDNHPEGPQAAEVVELLKSVPPDASRKVAVVHGCDEQGMVMLARHLRDKIEGRLPVGIWWSNPESINRVALFEGIPVGANLARFLDHLRISPLEVELGTWSHDAAVIIETAPNEVQKRDAPLLIIHNFESDQKDHLAGGRPAESTPTEGAGPIPFLTPLLTSDRADIFIADVSWANGGDPALDAALAQGNGNYLTGYSGWNTAGNTFGKALAHIVCRAYRKATDPTGLSSASAIWAQERWKFESLLTDRWFPQIVRPKLWKLVEDNGGDPWHFGLYTVELVEKGCADLRKPVKSSWDQRHRAIYRRRGVPVPDTVFPEITFPWNRLFEVDIRVYHDDAFESNLFSSARG